jgi:FkbM family methyltransferase
MGECRVAPLITRLKAPLKALRAFTPLNTLVTATMRAGLDAAGLRPEWVVRHVHRVGEVTAELPNGECLRLWSRGDDWVSNQVYWRGWAGYEPETALLFFQLATTARVTLDIGAYVGYYSLLAAHANPAGRVFAFEPLPGPAARLRRNLEANRLLNVECVDAAAGEADGTALLYHAPAALPTSSSLSQGFMREVADVRALEVRVLRLDDFLASRSVQGVDLVKVDTESTEAAVLSGMAGVLDRDRPFIVCEVLRKRGSEGPLTEMLRELRYQPFLLTPKGPVAKSSVEGDDESLNYLFAPAEKDWGRRAR